MSQMQHLLASLATAAAIALVGCASSGGSDTKIYHTTFGYSFKSSSQQEVVRENWPRLNQGMMASRVIHLLGIPCGVATEAYLRTGSMGDIDYGGNLLKFRNGRLTEFSAGVSPAPGRDYQTTRTIKEKNKVASEKEPPPQAGVKSQDQLPLDGKIDSIDGVAETITVERKIIQIMPKTEIYNSDNRGVTFDDFVIGGQVSIDYTKGEDGKPTAYKVVFGLRQFTVDNKLSAIDKAAKTMTVGEKIIQITDATKMIRRNNPATIDDFEVGEPVYVYFTNERNNELIAVSVRLGRLGLVGKVNAINKAAKTMVVGEQTIQVTDTTKISRGKTRGRFTDFMVGDVVNISYGKGNDNKLEAFSISYGRLPSKKSR